MPKKVTIIIDPNSSRTDFLYVLFKSLGVNIKKDKITSIDSMEKLESFLEEREIRIDDGELEKLAPIFN